MSAKVVVRDLRKHYGDVQAVRGVSFEVQQGEIFGLLGPNGGGKTTLVECIVGLREPDEGSIELFGMETRREGGDAKQRIGAVLQTTSLQEKITPREALRAFGSFYRERFTPEELLDRFSLADKGDAPFDTLSGGQRQRLALALAFVNNPELILLDEPTAGLDPQFRREFHDEILQMKKDGRTVLLTTHYVSEAEQLCDRIAILDHGRIVAMGEPSLLIARSMAAPSVFLSTVQPVDFELLRQLPGIQSLERERSGFRFSTDHTARTIGELMNYLDAQHIEISELHIQKATLEDVLIELIGDSQYG